MLSSLRDAAQEVFELGPRGALFRARSEIADRLGLARGADEPPRIDRTILAERLPWTSRLPLEDPVTLARRLRPHIPEADLLLVRARAADAARGRILCFGKWTADFGSPIDWHRDPVTGRRWERAPMSSRALGRRPAGDVKFCWECARFPHFYHLARASAFFPDAREECAATAYSQIQSFIAASPPGCGIHWASSQEVGLRSLSWIFVMDALLSRSSLASAAATPIEEALVRAATHISAHVDYARLAVNNNHLLSEALALFAIGALLPHVAPAAAWRNEGAEILDQQATRQFYDDGGYLQQSHNYHRFAVQTYLWACAFARSARDVPHDTWLKGLERSLDFLWAHQNPLDGRLPNYGSNDGALPGILSTCDFSDFRPTLQAVSLLVRGERLYRPGPWDEEAAWLLGTRALDAPLRTGRRRSISFPTTGAHVLRGRNESAFSAFRCGTLRHRFSQIDMLHLDVWWRGSNVLVDPGSYRYNVAEPWHNHFMRTGSHNTVRIDGRDQMVHYRQFKVLYWTHARLLRFEGRSDWAICEGEHEGFRRYAGGCVHRRAVLFAKDDLWIVVDRIAGSGEHHISLQWLGGELPWQADRHAAAMTLSTPAGPFFVSVLDARGELMPGDVVAGEEEPPRGWLSRYYGEKVAVPSLVVSSRQRVPATFVTLLAGGEVAHASLKAGLWTIEHANRSLSFRLADGLFRDLSLTDRF